MLIFTCSQYGSSPILNLFLTKSTRNNAIQYAPNSNRRIIPLLMLLYFLLWHISFHGGNDFPVYIVQSYISCVRREDKYKRIILIQQYSIHMIAIVYLYLADFLFVHGGVNLAIIIFKNELHTFAAYFAYRTANPEKKPF